ncbi:RNA polymerase sigma-70 factor [Siphonobacter aquaeclarae]|nr:RNA polymerase sigma-70 factor [Siphonobacter aquaeclarae]
MNLPDDSRQEKPVLQLHSGEMPREADKEYFIRQSFRQDPKKGCELLFRRYYAPLCSHAARYVYTREIAEDLVSDVFYTFWKKELHLEITTSFRAYLFTAVRHRCFSYLRAEMTTGKAPDFPEVTSPFPLPDSLVEYDELHLHIEKIVSELPPQRRKAFLMSRYEGRSYQEIAERMLISTKAVEAHISKSLRTLREALKDHWLVLITLAFHDVL